MNFYSQLIQKIDEKKANIGVVGMGYVGLPLAVEMVKSGFTVCGIDLSEDKINQLKKGHSYIQDVSHEEMEEVIASNRFLPTTDYEAVKELDAISICVPTPLSENQDPDTSYITGVINSIKPHMKKGTLITLESTTYPGTTEELILNEFKKMGYEAGKDFFLCYSPERVDPGNDKYNTQNMPKVIGGTTEQCTELGVKLYSHYVGNVVPVSSPKVAEMSKLLENTFRSINIAFVNEIAMMCERMDIDVWEVIDAAATKPFGFMKFQPGPGIGGHCIPLDPMYLSWKAKGYRFYSKFIDLAQSINNNMPDVVVSKTSQVLNLDGKSINRANILILGMAYKPNVADLRESPGLYLYELYKENGANVQYLDPHAQSFIDDSGDVVHSVPYIEDQLKQYDCMVLVTNHSDFDYDQLANLGVPIVDTRNAFKDYEQQHIHKLGTSSKVFDRQDSVAL
ncbi:nucleotide sugar dehydrogenase [Pontibacillus yanchengensis]|uniref:Nucleotide sugar dehydrogenase n=2 Tax=Pontibacillus yanchengensis TaxID=462910 RepID=A0ACC7VK49_9BACI|nr:nucleotide sugar dehydrogenase [Pontibacillus yanchengensis]MYL34657.1 nucleotide sugar dehydrogenase [Pontibacillus yanchengensis]MYL54524.1 nucleotide sugar dehydrogenase [Pontibacillus yanchengensis]